MVTPDGAGAHSRGRVEATALLLLPQQGRVPPTVTQGQGQHRGWRQGDRVGLQGQRKVLTAGLRGG